MPRIEGFNSTAALSVFCLAVVLGTAPGGAQTGAAGVVASTGSQEGKPTPPKRNLRRPGQTTAIEDAEREEIDDLFVDRVEVNVVNVDVFVTDKRGHRIPGLTRDDFEIYENKKRVPISNFYVVENRRRLVEPAAEVTAEEGGEPAPAVPSEAELEEIIVPEDQRLHLVVYVDNFNIRPLDRNRVMKDLRSFLLDHLDEQDRTMLVTYDRSLKVRQPFTSDPRRVAQATLEIERVTGHQTSRDSDRRDVLRRIEESESAEAAARYARSYAQSIENDLRFSLEAIKEMVGSLAGLPGRKALLYVSSGIPMVAGQDIFHAADQQHVGLGSDALMDSFNFDYSREFQELGSKANANRVTLYTLDASGLQVYSSISAENSSIGRGTSVENIYQNNRQDSLRFMARMTGGKAIVNTNGFDTALGKIAGDFTSYYSLGYRPAHFGDGRYYKIDVKVRRKGLEVRHRQGYRDLSNDSRMGDGTLAALYHSYESNNMGVKLEFGERQPREDGYYLVPVVARIPLRNVTLIPRGENHEGRLQLYLGAMDEKGGTSPVQQVPLAIKIPSDDIDRARETYYSYTATLLMRKGEQSVAMGVHDQIGAERAFVTKKILVSGG